MAVIGTGAVCPAGNSPAALGLNPRAVELGPLLSDPGKTVSLRRVDLSLVERWGHEPRLRRASPLALFLAEAARQALDSAPPVPRERLGLVTALGTGSIRFTRQFYERLLKKGRAQAAPVVFPETVYNSPVSHVASILGIEGACYTVVGDETAFNAALGIAQTWLTGSLVDAVLVVAGEEIDLIALEAYHRFGWFRRGLVATEGAGAVLLRREKTGDKTTIHPALGPHTFRSWREREAAWEKIIAAAAHPLLVSSNLAPGHLAGQLAPQASRLEPDHGFAFTASASWSFLQACEYRARNGPCTLILPGANTAVGAINFP